MARATPPHSFTVLLFDGLGCGFYWTVKNSISADARSVGITRFERCHLKPTAVFPYQASTDPR